MEVVIKELLILKKEDYIMKNELKYYFAKITSHIMENNIKKGGYIDEKNV
jgi:hypothetical protein